MLYIDRPMPSLLLYISCDNTTDQSNLSLRESIVVSDFCRSLEILTATRCSNYVFVVHDLAKTNDVGVVKLSKSKRRFSESEAHTTTSTTFYGFLSAYHIWQ